LSLLKSWVSSTAGSLRLSICVFHEYADDHPVEASRFLTGLVTCFTTQAGMPAVALAASRR
jgi:hypothetical protein